MFQETTLVFVLLIFFFLSFLKARDHVNNLGPLPYPFTQSKVRYSMKHLAILHPTSAKVVLKIVTSSGEAD